MNPKPATGPAHLMRGPLTCTRPTTAACSRSRPRALTGRPLSQRDREQGATVPAELAASGSAGEAETAIMLSS
jgi:hypothetical protein